MGEFNPEYLCLIGGGGRENVSLCTYYTADNLASATLGSEDAVTFDGLYTSYPSIAAGDIILVVNGASPVMTLFNVKSNSRSGTTVIASGGTCVPFSYNSATPSNPTAGLVVFADRVTWDPLAIGAGGAYLTMYLGATSGWGAITGQLD